METLRENERAKSRADEPRWNQLRDHLLAHQPLVYGYIDQPDRLINEIDLAIRMAQLDKHLDRLFETTNAMSNEVNQHNVLITRIGAQAMASGDLLTDYTLLGHDILGVTANSPTQLMRNADVVGSPLTSLAAAHGNKLLLHAVS
jgi:hypothetical protein